MEINEPIADAIRDCRNRDRSLVPGAFTGSHHLKFIIF